MNVLLIDGVEYRIGAKVKDADGKVGIITKFDVRHADDDVPLKVDFLSLKNPCGFYGPSAVLESQRITLVEPKKETKPELKRGTQIAYLPDHAEGNINHPDVEFGFVDRIRKDGDAYCRYWSKSNPKELRTKANSELTPAHCLVLHDSHPQAEVDAMLYEIEREG